MRFTGVARVEEAHDYEDVQWNDTAADKTRWDALGGKRVAMRVVIRRVDNQWMLPEAPKEQFTVFLVAGPDGNDSPGLPLRVYVKKGGKAERVLNGAKDYSSGTPDQWYVIKGVAKTGKQPRASSAPTERQCSEGAQLRRGGDGAGARPAVIRDGQAHRQHEGVVHAHVLAACRALRVLEGEVHAPHRQGLELAKLGAGDSPIEQAHGGRDDARRRVEGRRRGGRAPGHLGDKAAVGHRPGRAHPGEEDFRRGAGTAAARAAGEEQQREERGEEAHGAARCNSKALPRPSASHGLSRRRQDMGVRPHGARTPPQVLRRGELRG